MVGCGPGHRRESGGSPRPGRAAGSYVGCARAGYRHRHSCESAASAPLERVLQLAQVARWPDAVFHNPRFTRAMNKILFDQTPFQKVAALIAGQGNVPP